MRTLAQLGLAGVIVVATWFAINRVAEEKAGALAGGETELLGATTPEENHAFEALLTRLRGWGEAGLAGSLEQLRDDGDLWVAPHLAGQRSAITVSSLGLVNRVYVRQEELVSPELPFPDLDVPESAQRTFSTLRLAGTLYHELQHHAGLDDEAATYDREIEWYRGLRGAAVEPLEGEERHWFEWALDSAIQSAEAAREKAGATTGP